MPMAEKKTYHPWMIFNCLLAGLINDLEEQQGVSLDSRNRKDRPEEHLSYIKVNNGYYAIGVRKATSDEFHNPDSWPTFSEKGK